MEDAPFIDDPPLGGAGPQQPPLSGFAATQSGPSQFGVDGAADDEDFPASFYYNENEEDDSQTVANSPSPLAYRSHERAWHSAIPGR